jgi:subtilisin family serine protease
MKFPSICLIFFCNALSLTAQDTKIIFLKENTKQTQTENYAQLFSPRAIDRRERQNIEFNNLDLPVNQELIAALRSDGEILNVSRWLNALTFKSNMTADELLLKYDFIERIQVVETSTSTAINKLEAETKSLNYGFALEQVEQLNLDCLHDLGYTGSGIFLGVIDAGFRRMDSLSYFDSVHLEGRILDTFNFVNSTETVYGFSSHGTSVSSCIVGENTVPDQYIGTAVDVDLALYLTEDVSSETEIEEFNLVAALERADSIGIDLVNISLGYFGFDDSTTSHLYTDLDGVTTISAIGVNVAETKGIFVVSSAGNAGPSHIVTPCDAPGAFCVGAVNEAGDYAAFSSKGPAADGRVKPDAVARGEDAWIVNQVDSLQQGNGTSFASPILCGGVACLIQANPGRTVQDVMEAIRESSSQFSSPDDSMGYGIPDFCLANDILTASASIASYKESNVLIYPIPTRESLLISGLILSEDRVTISVYDNLGQLVLNEDKIVANGELKLNVSQLSNGLYNLVLSQEAFQVRRNISVSR